MQSQVGEVARPSKMDPIYGKPRKKKLVYLCFDQAWHPTYGMGQNWVPQELDGSVNTNNRLKSVVSWDPKFRPSLYWSLKSGIGYSKVIEIK